MQLGAVDFLQIGIVGDGFDPILERNHLVVARHDRDDSELQALREVHSADGDISDGRLDLVG